MKEAVLPAKETSRLRALNSYDVLDTLPDPAYDDIVHIASQICGAPIALVSLVDEDRQWFKSKTGLDATQTPRTLAFCAHAILDPSEVMVVTDAKQDERFADNPLVVGEPNVRFYAGAPLVTSDGHALGTLCVIDHQPRELTTAQLEALTALSRQVVALLELRRTLQEVDRKSAEIEHSRQELSQLCEMLESEIIVSERDLHRAEVIQRSLLPHAAPAIDNFCVQSLYQPGRIVGGDFFDVIGTGDRYATVIIADAAGHGVSAAMLSLLFKQHLRLINSSTGVPQTPTTVLTQVNEALAEQLTVPGAFVTAIVCVIDTQKQLLTLASAGHPPALLLTHQQRYEAIDNTGPALGLYAGAKYTEHTVSFALGDSLFLYTDGLFDLRKENPPDLQEIADRISTMQPVGGLESVFNDLAGTTSTDDSDDVTMLLIEARPGESHFLESPSNLQCDADLEDSKMVYAESDRETYLALLGRVTWTHCSAFYDAVIGVLDAGRALRLDLNKCEYLDSTMLGTLYEVVEHANAVHGCLTIHGVGEALAVAFNELHLTSVIANIDQSSLQVPARTRALRSSTGDDARHALRLLKSHDQLARLSPENRLEFGKLVDMLRDEVTQRVKR